MKTTAFIIVSALLVTGCGVPEKEVEELKSRLADAEQQLSRANTEIAKANAAFKKAEPWIQRGKTLPIETSKRKAVLGTGEVLMLQNLSTKTLPVAITFTSATFHKTNTFNRVLDPVKIIPSLVEIGHSEGWAVAPGDTVEISSEGYVSTTAKF